MSIESNISRRRFLSSSGAITGASLLRISTPSLIAIAQAACTAKQETAAFSVLNATDAADLAAISARIMPTTETPGASEAGVIYFFDRALGEELESMLPFILSNLAELNGESQRFSELGAAEQDALLTSIEDGEFFGALWFFTMVGFFAMSRYGGNKDNIAWDLIGFEGDHGAWEYPFGHYDAEYTREKANG
jgi:gluconate 2-dehydrogenase gamma chain